MRVKCPDCREKIEVDVNEYEEGDCIDCPECGLDLILEVKGGKFSATTEKAKYYDEDLEEELFTDD